MLDDVFANGADNDVGACVGVATTNDVRGLNGNGVEGVVGTTNVRGLNGNGVEGVVTNDVQGRKDV